MDIVNPFVAIFPVLDILIDVLTNLEKESRL